MFDFEATKNYTVTITSTDEGGLSFEKDITIYVLDVYETTITENPKTDNFLVYPNPSDGNITIIFNNPVSSNSIEVLNSVGMVIYSENNIDFRHHKLHQIDLSNQMKGFYLIRIINENNVYIKNIIIQ